MHAEPLPILEALPAPEPFAPRGRLVRAAAVALGWLAFLWGLDPRVLVPWVAPAGPADVTMRALTGAALTLGVFHLAERFPWERRRWPAWTAIHSLGALAFGAAAVSVVFPFHQYLAPDPTLRWTDAFLSSLHWHFLLYWFVLGVALALAYAERVRERERDAARLRLAASRLEAEYARARLGALRMQMQPHFLFNTLNAISELIHQDPRLASRTIAQLQDLLRLTLEGSGAQEVPLERELSVLDRYLAIQRTRFGDRLDVRMEVAPETRRALVPGLLLQPLVENALKYGVPGGRREQRVTVTARVEGSRLIVEVRDNGPGVAANHRRPGSGVGLNNIRARLEHLYGADARLELEDAEGGEGAVARVVLPLRDAEGG
ncbi:MAG TPA: sensor histidine kinase [Longimicrobium sp.]|jgi:two-component sensor histidine kinase